MQGKRWPSEAPAPQLFMGPRVDRIRDKGSAHWADYRERHGFHGVHITCAGLRLDNTGIKALADRMPYTWVWPWGDDQSGQAPPGGLMSSAALRYYDDLERLLGHLGPDRIGFGAGFDLHEWVADGDHDEAIVLMARWVEEMLGRFPGCMIGGRALVSDGPWPGTYAGLEHQVVDKLRFGAMLDAAIAAAGAVPTFTEDRFRERGSSRAKDWTQTQMLELGMPVALEQRVAAIWAVLRGGDQDAGCIDFDNPAAVRELLDPNGNGNGEPPPNGDECMPAAAYAAELRGIEERMQAEVIEPVQRDFTPSSWRGRLLAITGILQYLEPAQAILADAGLIIEEMETCTPPSSGNGGGNGGNGNGNGGNGNGDPPGVPGLDEITAVFPGTRNVLSWRVVPTSFQRMWTDGESVFAKWDELGRGDWPYFQVGDEPEALGVIWLVWKTRGGFIAAPAERLRRQRERTNTEFPFENLTDDPLVGGGDIFPELPGEGDLVGAFLAGPSRHIGRSKPEYEHRGPIEWFVWDSNGELERFVGAA